MTSTVTAAGHDAEVGVDLARMRRVALARPDDLAAHLVYADALMEAGDELGEFMHRQCMGSKEEAPYAVSRRLIGRLFPHAESWRVERGFLREVRLRRASPRDIRRLVGAPEWEGVTALSFGRGPTTRTQRLPAMEVFELINHPACHGLLEVTDLDDETLRRLADLSRTFDRIGVQLHPLRDAAFGPVKLTTKVLSLSHGANSVDWMLGPGRPLLEHVEALELTHAGTDPLMLIHDAGDQLVRIETPHVWATREGPKWRVRLTPHRFTEASVYWDVPNLVALIRGVTPRLSSLEIHMPDYGPAVLDRIRLAARELDFALVLTGPAEQLVSRLYTEADADCPF